MPKVMFPYGHGRMEYEFPEEGFLGSLVPPLHSYVSKGTPQELVERAVRIPVGCPPLHVLAQGKRRVVILVSDHTRPVPSRLILPVLLAEIRKGAPKAQITILVATGCHRATTEEELRKKLGPELAGQARVLVHDCDGPVADCGYLPSGGRLLLNKTALEADLLVAEGFIEPHFLQVFRVGGRACYPASPVAEPSCTITMRGSSHTLAPARGTCWEILCMPTCCMRPGQLSWRSSVTWYWGQKEMWCTQQQGTAPLLMRRAVHLCANGAVCRVLRRISLSHQMAAILWTRMYTKR